MQTLNRPNAAQVRARELTQRFTTAMPIPRDLSHDTALEVESLAIDEAGREIGAELDAMRLQTEISCLRVRLVYATGAEALDVAERLGAARLDLLQVECEMGE